MDDSDLQNEAIGYDISIDQAVSDQTSIGSGLSQGVFGWYQGKGQLKKSCYQVQFEEYQFP